MADGICEVDLEVCCLERPVHSGQKGGPVPDTVQLLCRIIAGLSAEDGPSFRVISFESQPVRGAGNLIVDVARARIAVRGGVEPGERFIRKLTRNPPCRALVRARIIRCAPDAR
jgi:hypothetical protein